MGSADLNATFYGPVKKVNINSLSIFLFNNLEVISFVDLGKLFISLMSLPVSNI